MTEKPERGEREPLRNFLQRLLDWEIERGWTQDPPLFQDWYWHWSGDEDDAPIPTSIFMGGDDLKPFVTCGQLGLLNAIPCDQYGGWWHPMTAPATPRP